MSQRTIALAGVFQATELVNQAARHGTWSGYAASSCLHSLLTMESDSVDDIYGGMDRLNLGIRVLIAVLQGDREHMDSLRYAINILQIERRFRRQKTLQATVGESLQAIANGSKDLQGHEREEQQAADIAKLYSQTISLINPRIVVQGHPQYLQVERTVNWIRTLLFAGLRSAVLWNQLGGGRLNLMFGRQKLLREAEELLTG